MSWLDRAACRGADVSVFFPPRGENATAAKAVCARCPVRVECLDDAVGRREEGGVWGGLSEKERRPLSKGRPPAPRPCGRCGTVFTPGQPTGRWCSKACRQAAYVERSAA